MKLMHGSRGPLALHLGLCLTDDRAAALTYSRDGSGKLGVVSTVEIDMYGLEVCEVEAFGSEHEDGSRGSRGDSAADRERLAAEGIDVVVFDDEDYQGREHTTWRIISERALARVKVI